MGFVSTPKNHWRLRWSGLVESSARRCDQVGPGPAQKIALWEKKETKRRRTKHSSPRESVRIPLVMAGGNHKKSVSFISIHLRWIVMDLMGVPWCFTLIHTAIFFISRGSWSFWMSWCPQAIQNFCAEALAQLFQPARASHHGSPACNSWLGHPFPQAFDKVRQFN